LVDELKGVFGSKTKTSLPAINHLRNNCIRKNSFLSRERVRRERERGDEKRNRLINHSNLLVSSPGPSGERERDREEGKEEEEEKKKSEEFFSTKIG